MIDSPYLVVPGRKFRLAKFAPADTGRFKEKEKAEQAVQSNLSRLGELQHVLYAEGRRAVLVILQGMDTSGKDGAIRHVFTGLNPQGCSVVSFKAPSSDELAHDYLWRVHTHAPARGLIGIFNRSHYESLLVERVHTIVPKSVWSRRYDHINAFEKILVDEGTVIIKFFLHISKEEQKGRLQARLRDPTKNWKYDPGDLEERKLWTEYQRAYEDALRKCSSKHAPWYVVPSDRKWFRNWLVSDVIVRTMESMKLKYPPPAEGMEKVRIK